MVRMKHNQNEVHANVTGTPVQRAASIIALADGITGTTATDDDIIDVLKRLKQDPTPGVVSAVRAILIKGAKKNG